MYFSASECLHFLQGCGFKSILGPELRVLYVKGSPVERPLASHDASGQDISPYTERANLGKAEPQCPVGKSLSLGVCVLAFFFFCFFSLCCFFLCVCLILHMKVKQRWYRLKHMVILKCKQLE